MKIKGIDKTFCFSFTPSPCITIHRGRKCPKWICALIKFTMQIVEELNLYAVTKSPTDPSQTEVLTKVGLVTPGK